MTRYYSLVSQRRRVFRFFCISRSRLLRRTPCSCHITVIVRWVTKKRTCPFFGKVRSRVFPTNKFLMDFWNLLGPLYKYRSEEPLRPLSFQSLGQKVLDDIESAEEVKYQRETHRRNKGEVRMRRRRGTDRKRWISMTYTDWYRGFPEGSGLRCTEKSRVSMGDWSRECQKIVFKSSQSSTKQRLVGYRTNRNPLHQKGSVQSKLLPSTSLFLHLQ